MKVAVEHKNEPQADTPDTAAYLAEMTGSLAAIARQHGLETLSYLLEMAREEAQNNARPANAARGRQ